ncbi:hypothetical protein LSH36_359g02028 [Paralvinella palmiformis]|uniref:Uncharacterized protein n=1 Tax=Paralvinella palmiformis TaxID=53620 RepID=A0AAD9JEQ9_9ANNE|nr:hypothetical protein LSH36_359g02028 [Paralvinella palmiformis]
MISELTAENTMLKKSLNVMTLHQDSLSSRMSDLESQECKTQLLLSNVPETGNEGTMTFFSRNVEIEIDLESRYVAHAYIIGKYNKDKRRSILIKFSTYYARQLIWDKRALTPGEMYPKHAYPENIATQRRILQQIVNKARSMGQYKEKAHLRHNRIVINDRAYTIEHLAELANDLKAVVGCDEIDNIEYFYGSQCPVSNFYQAKFTVGGIVFSCVEQAYFYHKAGYYCDKSKSA